MNERPAGMETMRHFLRQYWIYTIAVVLVGLGLAATPAAKCQTRDLVELLQEPSPMLGHGSSQGYLGVDLADVDQEKAQSLKLKETRGAIITLIDHDAPAGKIGLKVNDVVVKLNGQPVEGAEQLRRMLREVPAGHKVTLEISRDGNLQTVNVELADRQAMEHDVWNRIGSSGDVFASPQQGMGMLSGGDSPMPGGFHMPFFGSSLNVGAMVEPLTSQMAEYLGVPAGIMIKQVANKSEAANAGMRVFDVILKVGGEQIKTLADWDRSLRSNQGKPVQVTILRDKRMQTLTLQVDSKHHSEIDWPVIFTDEGNCPLATEAAMEIAPQITAELEAAEQAQAEAMRSQAEVLRNEMASGQLKLDEKQLDEIKRRAEEFGKNFKFEPRQTEEMINRLDLDGLKVDPGQMKEFQEQMKEQMKEFERQMEEWSMPGVDGKA